MVWSGDEEKRGLGEEMYRVEGRRPVGRPRRTWLESVEADMAELEIDRDMKHDRKKWRNNLIKRKSKPYRKTDYKLIIDILMPVIVTVDRCSFTSLGNVEGIINKHPYILNVLWSCNLCRSAILLTNPACTWWKHPEQDLSSSKLESTHPSRTSVKSTRFFTGNFE